MANKKTLNLNVQFKSLGSTEVKTDAPTIGRMLAELFAVQAKSDNPLKVYGWAEDLYENKSIELDEADVKMFKDVLTTLKDKTTIMFQAQLDRLMDAQLASKTTEPPATTKPNKANK